VARRFLTPELVRWGRRHAFALMMLIGAISLLAWIGILAATLPDQHSDKQWKAAWVGFDSALMIGMIVTAVGAWQRRQFVTISCLITSTLLFCDAWFDVILSWGTGDLLVAVLFAVVGEIPFGAFLFFWATRIIRRSATAALRSAGYDGPMPSLWKLSAAHFGGLVPSKSDRPLEPAEPRSPGADSGP
jgi:hypothetical protein